MSSSWRNATLEMMTVMIFAVVAVGSGVVFTIIINSSSIVIIVIIVIIISNISIVVAAFECWTL